MVEQLTKRVNTLGNFIARPTESTGDGAFSIADTAAILTVPRLDDILREIEELKREL